MKKSRFATAYGKKKDSDSETDSNGSTKGKFKSIFNIDSNPNKIKENRYLSLGTGSKKNKNIFIDLKRIEDVQDDDDRMKFQIVEQSRRMA